MDNNDISDAELDLVPCWPCRGQRAFSAHAPDEFEAHLLVTCVALEHLDARYCRLDAALDQYATAHRN